MTRGVDGPRSGHAGGWRDRSLDRVDAVTLINYFTDFSLSYSRVSAETCRSSAECVIGELERTYQIWCRKLAEEPIPEVRL